MNTSATLQHTIQIRPSRLAALLVAVVMLTAVTTWSVGNISDTSHSSAPEPEVVASSYVEGVTALSPGERAAIYGNVPSDLQRAIAVSSLSPAQQAATFGNVPQTPQYVDGITHLTPAQLAAMFGNVPFDSTP